ncbi:hypothetical protein INS49_015284 [Diaporthe citri]|uniref:uncharacterized protein n=1 Tax=Diaporthe citri TaxID=83186 RepID=UPI001C7EAFB9|nr:uncharacterized protein INS49_015284 [Diaporthe citri]KAG6355900.1 hypothetical protein INS49_015284 [Diaporthe citri]
MAHRVSRRDSWPPTMMRLHPSIETEDTAMDIDPNHDELSLEDDDPINYFLTPTPLLDDGDTDDDMDSMDLEMDMFNAGIEDPHHPQPTIRSISPSDLTGPSRPPSALPKMLPLPIRSPTPPKARSNSRSPPSRNSPEALTPTTEHDDDDDDEEDYVRFTPSGTLAPFSLYHNFASSKSKGASRKAAAAAQARAQRSLDKNDRVGMMMAHGPSTSSANLLLPPDAFHPVGGAVHDWSSGRVAGLAPRTPGPLERTTACRRERGEPSPDVWSIEEDPEAEMMSEFGEGSVEVDTLGHKSEAMTPGGDKAGKKVRFALPVTEIP